MNFSNDKIDGPVYITDNLDQFVDNRNNRELRLWHVRELAENMKTLGYNTEVIRVRPDMVLITGHHRVAAAKLAGLKIRYVISHDKPTTYEAAAAHELSEAWKKMDYVKVFARNKPSYQTLVRLHEEYGAHKLSVGQIYILLTGSMWSDSAHNDTFKRGNFEVTDGMVRRFHKRAENLIYLASLRGGVFRTKLLAQKNLVVLSAMFDLPEYDQKQMFKHLGKAPENDVIFTFNRLADAARAFQRLYNNNGKAKSKIDLVSLFPEEI